MRPLALVALALLACDARSSSSPSGPAASSSAREAPSSSPSDAPSTPPPAPSSSPAAPYDLAADLAARTTAARTAFPAAAYPAFATRVDEGTFLLVSPGGRATLDAGAFELRRALAFYFGGHSSPADPTPPFTHRPERAVTVYLLPTHDAFVAFARTAFHHDATRELGVYLHEPRAMVLSARDGYGTLDHELVHVATEVDAPALPTWMNECLGSVFEQPVFDADGSMHGARNARTAMLADVIRRKKADGEAPPGIADLFGMSGQEFRGGLPVGADGGFDPAAKASAMALNYARVRALCMWLDEKPRSAMWRVYHAWRDEMAADAGNADPSGAKAFERIVGKRPDEVEDAWRAWVTK